MPRLAYLSSEDRRFVELFVLSSGSIKKMEKALGISYPTVRNRLDKIVSSLRKIIEQDDSASAEGMSEEPDSEEGLTNGRPTQIQEIQRQRHGRR